MPHRKMWHFLLQFLFFEWCIYNIVEHMCLTFNPLLGIHWFHQRLLTFKPCRLVQSS
jgi:hypothetical protein